MTLDSLGSGLHGPLAELVQIQPDVWHHIDLARSLPRFPSPLSASGNFNKVPEPGGTLESTICYTCT